MPVLLNRFYLVLILTLLVPFWAGAATEPPKDSAALAKLQTGKAIFDIRTKEAGRLLFTLKVIEETESGMRSQGVAPDFVLSFRGGTLPLLKAEPETANSAELAMLSEVRERLAEFRERGMVLEACNVAATLFKMDRADLDPTLHLVGNSLISLIGYQNKGYALVPMY